MSPEFIATIAKWTNWPDLDRDRPSLLLAAEMASRIDDNSTDDGPCFHFLIDAENYEWGEGDGWDCMDGPDLLNLIAARWLAGTLPSVPTLTPNGDADPEGCKEQCTTPQALSANPNARPGDCEGDGWYGCRDCLRIATTTTPNGPTDAGEDGTP